MDTNLGIYNNHHMYNENINYDINKHIEQGTQFEKYGKKYQADNQHSLLTNSSSSEWRSIVDTTNEENAINQPRLYEGMQSTPSDDEYNFNKLVSEYATLYNTYTTTMLRKSKTDAQRMSMEYALISKKTAVMAAADRLQSNVNNNKRMLTNPTQLNIVLHELDKHKKLIDNSDDKYNYHTLGGKLETTSLNMTSMYYHYFVYFVISITLLAFTFYTMVNPNANIMNAVYVVVGLLAVYFITRRANIE